LEVGAPQSQLHVGNSRTNQLIKPHEKDFCRNASDLEKINEGSQRIDNSLPALHCKRRTSRVGPGWCKYFPSSLHLTVEVKSQLAFQKYGFGLSFVEVDVHVHYCTLL